MLSIAEEPVISGHPIEQPFELLWDYRRAQGFLKIPNDVSDRIDLQSGGTEHNSLRLRIFQSD